VTESEKISSNSPWTLPEALAFAAELESVLSMVGFTCGLVGSVLHNLFSQNDLDIVIFPLDTSNFNMALMWEAMENIGMKRRCTRGVVATTWEKHYKSNDQKNVEKWLTKDGRAVDVFHLR
jgi:hypothetical protein